MRSKKVQHRVIWLCVLIIAAAVAAASLAPRWSSNAVAQGGRFSNAHLRGTYAFATAGGSPTEATLGYLTADGNGRVTSATLRLNVPTSVLVPGATGRSVVPATGSGTYTLNPDGTGTAAATVNTAAGTLTRNFELIVSASEGNLATEILAGQRESTLAGGLGYYILKRVSD